MSLLVRRQSTQAPWASLGEATKAVCRPCPPTEAGPLQGRHGLQGRLGVRDAEMVRPQALPPT